MDFAGFLLQLSKKHKIVAADKQETEDVLLGASDSVGSTSVKKFQASWLAKCFVSSYSLYRSICS